MQRLREPPYRAPHGVEGRTLLCVCAVLSLLSSNIAAADAVHRTLYASPEGKSTATCGKASDPGSLAQVLNRVKELAPGMDGDIVVNLFGGRYSITAPVVLGPEHSGTNGFRVILKAQDPTNPPIFCGGVKIVGWARVAGKPYYKASAQGVEYCRQMYVNGVRAQRASSPEDLRSSRPKEWWDDPATPEKPDGIWVHTSRIKSSYTNPEDLRVSFIAHFKHAEIPVVAVVPGDDDEAILKLRQPDIKTWAGGWCGRLPDKVFYVVNAFEELDEPGEWYHNRKTDTVYYYPHSFEDMNTAEVWLPRTETLLRVEGKSEVEKVRNVTIEGIVFRYGNWLFPRDRMIGCSQAEFMPTYDESVPGQVVLNHTEGVVLHRNRLVHLGSCGIQVRDDNDNTRVEGNLFYDLTAAGVTVGCGTQYKQMDRISRNVLVRNNVVRAVGADYLQGTGINAFCSKDLKIHHNDVADTMYMGIHQRANNTKYDLLPEVNGTEFVNNLIAQSNLHAAYGMADGGMLYTHGPIPNGVARGNVCRYAVRQGATQVYYLDNFTSAFTMEDNVGWHVRDTFAPISACNGPPGKFGPVVIRNTYMDRQLDRKHIKNVTVENYVYVDNDVWPEEAKAIMAKAGVQDAYRDLTAKVSTGENLALGKPATASSSNGVAMAADKGNDGDENTIWHVVGDNITTPTTWWQVDLGATYVIQKINLIPRWPDDQPEARRNFQVQASNDKDFKEFVVLTEQNEVPFRHQTVSAGTYNMGERPHNQWTKYVNRPEGYRFVRLVKTKGLWMNFAELEVFGYGSNMSGQVVP